MLFTIIGDPGIIHRINYIYC